MNSLLFSVVAVALCCGCSKTTTAPPSQSEATEDAVRLFSHKRRSGVIYEWWLPVSRVKGLPEWQPEKEPLPPLSLSKAIRIARNVGEKWEKLESVAILSIPGADYAPPFDTVFYYRCTFQVEPFDRRACIVLMDGTILEPKAVGTFGLTDPAEAPSDEPNPPP